MIDFVVHHNVTAIFSVAADPMRTNDVWTKFYDEYVRPRNITVVCGDDMKIQLEYLSKRYVQALVGQLPYDMGVLSLQTLYDLARGQTIPHKIIVTNILTHIFVPLNLPEFNVDMNL
jgi:ABC-type sugar transport system substrate-binding protein